MSNYKLVYSSDKNLNEKLNQKDSGNILPVPDKISPVLALEKSGRGGKTVTVISKLPLNDDYLKKLTTEIKKSCGTGGTHKIEDGKAVIEIQGDKRNEIRAFFLKKGIECRGM